MFFPQASSIVVPHQTHYLPGLLRDPRRRPLVVDVDVEVGAESAGVLTKILHQSGDDVSVGDVLAEIDPNFSPNDESEEDDDEFEMEPIKWSAKSLRSRFQRHIQKDVSLFGKY